MPQCTFQGRRVIPVSESGLGLGGTLEYITGEPCSPGEVDAGPTVPDLGFANYPGRDPSSRI